jgi:hypothetical protein
LDSRRRESADPFHLLDRFESATHRLVRPHTTHAREREPRSAAGVSTRRVLDAPSRRRWRESPRFRPWRLARTRRCSCSFPRALVESPLDWQSIRVVTVARPAPQRIALQLIPRRKSGMARTDPSRPRMTDRRRRRRHTPGYQPASWQASSGGFSHEQKCGNRENRTISRARRPVFHMKIIEGALDFPPCPTCETHTN